MWRLRVVMSKLYVIRHAEPAVQGVLLGRADPPLSGRGLRDAREKLRNLDVVIAYSSPLARCRETAGVLGAPIRILDNLAEISFGEWDGLSWEQIERRYPSEAGRKSRDWFGVTPPGGEEWTVFAARIRAAIDEIRKGPGPAAVVTHVAVNSVIAQILTGSEPAVFQQENCEIDEYEFEFQGPTDPAD